METTTREARANIARPESIRKERLGDTPELARVKSATATDQERLISTIILAFSQDPVVRWFYPEAEQYLANWPAFVKAFAGAAFEHGTAYYAGDFEAAAFWLPPAVHADEDGLIDVIDRTVAGEVREELLAFLDQMAGHHPIVPHWYLPLIGVDPHKQGRGLGSALLSHALDRCDRDQKPAYLESSHPRNVPLYERHGFKVVATIQVGSSPTIWAMLRDPGQPGGSNRG